jgi:CHAT domain-containing protein
MSLALVAERRAGDRNLPTLAAVDQEVIDIATLAESRGVNSIHRLIGSTTILSASALIRSANIAHIACHGIQDIVNATNSGFCLGDGRLTISDLMELDLQNPFLAFLSACETAKGDQEQPDLTMHLAAAMLFAGFTSVVATIWCVHMTDWAGQKLINFRSISDSDGPQVAQWFYEELFRHDDINADSVPYALDVAMERLRQSGAPPERWAPFIHMGA